MGRAGIKWWQAQMDATKARMLKQEADFEQQLAKASAGFAALQHVCGLFLHALHLQGARCLSWRSSGQSAASPASCIRQNP